MGHTDSCWLKSIYQPPVTDSCGEECEPASGVWVVGRDDVAGGRAEDFFPLAPVGGFDFPPDRRIRGLLDAGV